MNKPKIILIGGGGHCKSCIDVIEAEGKYQIEGILDLPGKLGNEILGYKVIGNDNDIIEFAKQGFSFLLTVGHLGNPVLRKKLFNEVEKYQGNLPIIISPLAYVSKHAKIEKGTIIMHQTLVNANAKIGKNCIINNKSLIEHDATIGGNTHISTGAIVNGACKVGENGLVGSSSVIKHLIQIKENTIIGAGAVVVKDITESGVYVGSPAKKIK